VNPTGNQPRTPIVIGEVDVKSGSLRQETMRVIDERGDGDSPLLALSNFSAREDRETSELVVNMSRLFERSRPEPERDWTSDAYLYRVRVKEGAFLQDPRGLRLTMRRRCSRSGALWDVVQTSLDK